MWLMPPHTSTGRKIQCLYLYLCVQPSCILPLKHKFVMYSADSLCMYFVVVLILFCRLWKRSSLVERYFLVLRKVRTSSVASSAVHVAGKKRPVSSTSLNIGGVEGKNTRIKFD